jgi:hypothetical protein
MDGLSHDILFCIAKELDILSLLSFSRINKRTYEKLYNRQAIWKYSLEREFEDWEKFEFNNNLQGIYIKLYEIRNFVKKVGKPTRNLHENYKREKVNLSYKELKNLPKGLKHLTNTKELHLTFNMITEISIEMSFLIKLKELWLGYNGLTQIPTEVENF